MCIGFCFLYLLCLKKATTEPKSPIQNNFFNAKQFFYSTKFTAGWTLLFLHLERTRITELPLQECRTVPLRSSIFSYPDASLLIPTRPSLRSVSGHHSSRSAHWLCHLELRSHSWPGLAAPQNSAVGPSLQLPEPYRQLVTRSPSLVPTAPIPREQLLVPVL
jgi:hypothetical protein